MPEPCKVFINYLNTGNKCTLSNFPNDTKLGGTADSPQGKEALQRDVGKTRGLAVTKHMKFDKSK